MQGRAKIHKKRRKVKSILVSQKAPVNVNSPYRKLIEKFDLEIEFRPFIQVKPLSAGEFRKQKITILDYSAIIFTSRNAVDHFFGLCLELGIEMPMRMKYFCISEQTSNYLQKYVVMRKRKVFAGSKSTRDLLEIIKKHRKERFLFLCSNVRTSNIPNSLKENGIECTEAIIHNTVSADLSDLDYKHYDIMVFFSPAGVESLKVNFQNFEQNNMRIAAFGVSTAQAVCDAGLRLDVRAPLPDVPSMTGALELYIREVNGTAK